MKWEHGKLRKKIEARLGRRHADLMNESAQGFGIRAGMAGYHMHESAKLMRDIAEQSPIYLPDDDEATAGFKAALLGTSR